MLASSLVDLERRRCQLARRGNTRNTYAAERYKLILRVGTRRGGTQRERLTVTLCQDKKNGLFVRCNCDRLLGQEISPFVVIGELRASKELQRVMPPSFMGQMGLNVNLARRASIGRWT
jgi:hypothetical protein